MKLTLIICAVLLAVVAVGSSPVVKREAVDDLSPLNEVSLFGPPKLSDSDIINLCGNVSSFLLDNACISAFQKVSISEMKVDARVERFEGYMGGHCTEVSRLLDWKDTFIIFSILYALCKSNELSRVNLQ